MTIAQIIVAAASSNIGPQHSENGVYIWDGRNYDGSVFISSSSTPYPLSVSGALGSGPTAVTGSWGGTENSYWMNFANGDFPNNYGFQTPNLNQYGNWKINNIGNNSFTMQLWFYPTLATGSVLVGMNDGGVGPYVNNMLEINSDGHVYAQLWENAQSGSPLISTSAIVQNAWNHVFLQYNASALTLILSLNNDTPTSLTSYTPVVLPTGDNIGFLLGKHTANKMTTNGDVTFQGRMAYVQVSNSAVNSDFISQRSWFYNTYTAPAYGNGSLGGSMYFNGTTSYLAVPITSTGLRFAPGTSDYTIEWWQYMTSEGSWPYPFSISNPDTGQQQLAAYFQYGQIQLSDADHTNVAFGTGLNSQILNKWAHIAIVRNNGYMTVYVNGISINDPALYYWPTNVANLGPSGAKFTIGGQIDVGGSSLRSGTPFTGVITNFNFINGLAKYTSGFVPSALPFTVESGVVTKMLLLASTEANVIYDTAASHNVLTNNNVLWSSVSPFVVPQLWLDSANSNSWTPHDASGSIKFVNAFPDGQYLSTTVAATGSTDTTYEWWFNQTSSTPITQGMLQTRTNAIDGDGFDVSVVDGAIEITTAGGVIVNGLGTISTNTWYHIALVRVGSTAWTVYLNGVSVGTFQFTGPSSTELSIGRKSATTYNEFFNGYITNFRYVIGTAVYTGNFNAAALAPLTAITGTELLLSAVHGANFLVDSSTNAHTVTNNNTATSAFINPFDVWHDLGIGAHNATFPNSVTYSASNSGVLQFAAADSQFGLLPDLGNFLKFTINVWYNLASTTPGANPAFFTEQLFGGVINYALGFPTASDEIAGGFFNGNWQTAGAITPTTATWVNLTLTYDGATIKLYQNGTLNASTSYGATPLNNGTGSFIGRRWDSADFVDGSIPVVQLYNYALSASEVTALNAAFSPRY